MMMKKEDIDMAMKKVKRDAEQFPKWFISQLPEKQIEPIKQIKLIQQRSRIDCGICSLAMALGRDYENINLEPNPKYGISIKMMVEYLVNEGFDFQLSWDWEEENGNGPEFESKLILISSSDIPEKNLKQDVDVTTYGYHWVVADKQENILDSAKKPRNFDKSLKIVSIGIYR